MATEEYTPLGASDEVYYVELADESILPAFIQKNKTVKYGLCIVLGVVLLGLLYVMIILLPSVAPEGVQIPDIPMVKDSKVYLHPIIPEKVKGKNPDPDDGK